MLKQDSFVQAQLVSVGWRWAKAYSGGHIAGQMVMHTVANRVRCGWGTWLEVIDRIPKYMAENEIPPISYPSVWEPSFVKLLHTVEGIYDGSASDLSKGALYWASLSNIQRPWFKDLIAASNPTLVEDGSGLELRQHPLISSAEGLSFFR